MNRIVRFIVVLGKRIDLSQIVYTCITSERGAKYILISLNNGHSIKIWEFRDNDLEEILEFININWEQCYPEYEVVVYEPSKNNS